MSALDMGVLSVEDGEVSYPGTRSIMGDGAAWPVGAELNSVLLELQLCTPCSKETFTDQPGRPSNFHQSLPVTEVRRPRTVE